MSIKKKICLQKHAVFTEHMTSGSLLEFPCFLALDNCFILVSITLSAFLLAQARRLQLWYSD